MQEVGHCGLPALLLFFRVWRASMIKVNSMHAKSRSIHVLHVAKPVLIKLPSGR
jgi:hypothetical protein